MKALYHVKSEKGVITLRTLFAVKEAVNGNFIAIDI